MIRIAKNHLDIGLFTKDIENHHQFWSETVKLDLDHELKFNRDITQHRYDAHNSVIKVNQHKGALEKVWLCIQQRSGTRIFSGCHQPYFHLRWGDRRVHFRVFLETIRIFSDPQKPCWTRGRRYFSFVCST